MALCNLCKCPVGGVVSQQNLAYFGTFVVNPEILKVHFSSPRLQEAQRAEIKKALNGQGWVPLERGKK